MLFSSVRYYIVFTESVLVSTVYLPYQWPYVDHLRFIIGHILWVISALFLAIQSTLKEGLFKFKQKVLRDFSYIFYVYFETRKSGSRVHFLLWTWDERREWRITSNIHSHSRYQILEIPDTPKKRSAENKKRLSKIFSMVMGY